MAAAVQEKLEYLEAVLIRFIATSETNHSRTVQDHILLSKGMREFKDEMLDFKDVIREFKNNLQADQRKLKKKIIWLLQSNQFTPSCMNKASAEGKDD